MKVATLNPAINDYLGLKNQLEQQKSELQSINERVQSIGQTKEFTVKSEKIKEEIAKQEKNLKNYEDNLIKKGMPREDLNLYAALTCGTDAKSLHDNGFDDWLRIENIYRTFSDCDRGKYEAFVEGWLLYFEKHSSTNIHENRTLFFDWRHNKHDKPGKFDLIIYLKPLYSRNYTDYKLGNYESTNHTTKQYGMADGSSAGIKSPLPQPPSTTDPHQPPPPPPPGNDI